MPGIIAQSSFLESKLAGRGEINPMENMGLLKLI
jgi:hypothetical protein